MNYFFLEDIFFGKDYLLDVVDIAFIIIPTLVAFVIIAFVGDDLLAFRAACLDFITLLLHKFSYGLCYCSIFSSRLFAMQTTKYNMTILSRFLGVLKVYYVHQPRQRFIVLSKYLSRQFQFLFERELFIKFIHILVLHIVTLRSLIYPSHTMQISRNQFFAEEE